MPNGATRDLRLIPAAGGYKLRCTHFMPSAFGMAQALTGMMARFAGPQAFREDVSVLIEELYSIEELHSSDRGTLHGWVA